MAAAGGEPAIRAIPRMVRLEYAAPADRDAQLLAETWTTADGWSYRLSDEAGQELLRARLEVAAPVSR